MYCDHAKRTPYSSLRALAHRIMRVVYLSESYCLTLQLVSAKENQGYDRYRLHWIASTRIIVFKNESSRYLTNRAIQYTK